MKKLFLFLVSSLAFSTACAQSNDTFNVEPVFEFERPWAMAFLPDGRILVTEKSGVLRMVSQDGESLGIIQEIPNVAFLELA